MNIKDIVLQTIKRSERDLATEAMLVRLDDVTADIRIGTSASIIKNVAIRGDSSGLSVGQTVPITWEDRAGSYGQVPVVSLGGNVSTRSTDVAITIPDNVTLYNTALGMAVKPGGIGFEHLKFTPVLQGHTHIGELEGAGWQVTDTGRIMGQYTTISKEGQIALGSSPTTLYLDGMHSDYRLWIGNDDPVQAVFAIKNNGEIVATAGTLGALTVNGTITVGTGGSIQSSNYSSGASGWMIDNNGNAEFNNIIARGQIQSAVFVKEFIQALYGSFIVAKSAAVLSADATVSDTIVDTTTWDITVKADAAPFSSGDIVRLKNAAISTWGTVGGSVDNLDGTFTYTATFKSGSAGTYEVGLAVIDYGTTGDGFLYMTASDADAPFYSVRSHAGSPWTTTIEHVRIGYLNGWYGQIIDGYGVAMGNHTSGNYFLYNPSDIAEPFKISTGDGVVSIGLDGISMVAGDAGGPNYISWTESMGTAGIAAWMGTSQSLVNSIVTTDFTLLVKPLLNQDSSLTIGSATTIQDGRSSDLTILTGAPNEARIELTYTRDAVTSLITTEVHIHSDFGIIKLDPKPDKWVQIAHGGILVGSTGSPTAGQIVATSSLLSSNADFANVAAPAAPGAGYVRLYGNSDKLYLKEGAGTAATRLSGEEGLGMVVEGHGSAIATGVKGYIECPFDCDVLMVTAVAREQGSLAGTIDKIAYADFPSGSWTKITDLSLSNVYKGQGNLSATLAKGDIVRINFTSVTTITQVGIWLRMRKK